MTEGFRVTGEKPPSPARKYFSIDFYTAEQVYQGGEVDEPGSLNSRFHKIKLINFKNSANETDMVAVVRAGSDVLIDDLSMIAEAKSQHDDVTPESLAGLMDRFVESYMRISFRPNAELWTDESGSKITCYEEACRFHDQQKCCNPKPLIYDDCAMDQWCMTFEERDGE